MLNILPSTPSPCPPSPVSHRPPSSVRKRGGQPSNRNAFQHGFYSRKHPTPYAKLSNSMDCYRLIMAEGSPKDFVRAIRDLGKQMDLLLRLVQTVADAGNTPLVLALSKLGLKVTRTSRRLKIMLHRYLQPARDLQYVADHALELIYYDFWDHRITRDADSFRIEFKKSDLNSISSLQNLFPPFMEPDFPFLTPRQWQVLVPLIPPLQPNLPSPNPKDLGRGRGRGRPPADPHLILAAIFWKIAHHARWQDYAGGRVLVDVARSVEQPPRRKDLGLFQRAGFRTHAVVEALESGSGGIEQSQGADSLVSVSQDHALEEGCLSSFPAALWGREALGSFPHQVQSLRAPALETAQTGKGQPTLGEPVPLARGGQGTSGRVKVVIGIVVAPQGSQ